MPGIFAIDVAIDVTVEVSCVDCVRADIWFGEVGDCAAWMLSAYCGESPGHSVAVALYGWESLLVDSVSSCDSVWHVVASA